MPPRLLILLFAIVIAAAALTIWALNLGGPGFLITALPVFTIAVLALRMRRK